MMPTIAIGHKTQLGGLSLNECAAWLNILMNSPFEVVTFEYMNAALNTETITGKPLEIVRRAWTYFEYLLIEVATEDPDIFIKREIPQSTVKSFTPIS